MKQNEQISVSNLKNVAETLLYTLISRYVETKKLDGVISDPKSVEIIDSLDYDVNKTKLFPISQLGACFRTIIFDEAVNKFLKANPDGVVINLGCGLDTRFPRIDNGRVIWFDLDLPETIEIRRHFFEETDKHRFIAKSALDPSWADEVPKGKKTCIIMEGLSFYFTEEENRRVLSIIMKNFPEAEFFMEAFHPLFIKICSFTVSKDPLDKKASSLLKWGIKSGKKIEDWFEGVRFIEEEYVINKGRERFSLSNRILFALIPLLPKMTKIIHLQFE
jgi:O-methyltransferase involved in polyketide biosynthesis